MVSVLVALLNRRFGLFCNCLFCFCCVVVVVFAVVVAVDGVRVGRVVVICLIAVFFLCCGREDAFTATLPFPDPPMPPISWRSASAAGSCFRAATCTHRARPHRRHAVCE